MQLSGVLLSLLSLVPFGFAQTPTGSPLPGSSSIEVRDPSIIYNPDSAKYFVFSTDNNIGIFTSTALTGPWTMVGSVLPDCSIINMAGNCNLWAPDVNYLYTAYVLYYAISTINTQNSAIGLATSYTAEPGSWYDWGAVITSTTGDAYNAIDANVLNSNGIWLNFGSYWDGIFQVPLVNASLTTATLPGTHIAGYSPLPAEGGFIYQSPQQTGYYYAFFSEGITPLIGAPSYPAAGQEYKVLVGRSTSPNGPFTDQNGNELTTTVSPYPGTLVLGSHDNVYAPGGQSLYHDPVSGRDIIVYHYIPADAAVGSPAYLGINYMDYSSGWPILVDQ